MNPIANNNKRRISGFEENTLPQKYPRYLRSVPTDVLGVSESQKAVPKDRKYSNLGEMLKKYQSLQNDILELENSLNAEEIAKNIVAPLKDIKTHTIEKINYLNNFNKENTNREQIQELDTQFDRLHSNLIMLKAHLSHHRLNRLTHMYNQLEHLLNFLNKFYPHLMRDSATHLYNQLSSFLNHLKEKPTENITNAEIKEVESKYNNLKDEVDNVRKSALLREIKAGQDKLKNLQKKRECHLQSIGETKYRESLDIISKDFTNLSLNEMIELRKKMNNLYYHINCLVDTQIIKKLIYKTKSFPIKFSRRKYTNLSHSYFVVTKTENNRQKYEILQVFHKTLNEQGFIASGGFKNVSKLKNFAMEEAVTHVIAVAKPGPPIRERAIEALKEFKDEPHLCGGHFVTWSSARSGQTKYGFISPYMPSDLSWLLETKVVDGKQRLDIMLQTSLGLLAMHQKGWIHRDIKLENVLIDESINSELLNVKLADFDFSDKPDENSFLKSSGTLGYIAPEFFSGSVKGNTAGKKCDIYSLGVLFWALSEGKATSFFIKLPNGRLAPTRNYEELIAAGFPPQEQQTPLQQLIYRMINPKNPLARPSIEEVIGEIRKLQSL